MDCQQYKEIISAHVDAVLSVRERSEAESHLDQCPRCRQMAAWETNATKALKQILGPVPAKHELKQRVLDQLGEISSSSSHAWLYLPRVWVPVLASLFIFVSMYLAWPGRVQEDVFADTLTRYRHAMQGRVGLAPMRGSTLAAQLLDLTPWGYHLLGKETLQIRGQERRIFVYRGEQQDLLVAQVLDKARLPYPPGSNVLKRSGREFVSTSEGDIHLVAWQDKNVVCVLASNMSRDSIVALAEQIATRG